MPDIFSHHDQQATEILSDIYLIRGLASTDELLVGIKNVIQQAPLRFMYTPGGKRLNISMTNCGQLGWISDQAGYRYANTDPTRLRQAVISLTSTPTLVWSTITRPASK